VLALVCGAVGGLLVPRFFDLFVIGASAVSGAAMVMTGANHILPGVGFFDRAARRRVAAIGRNNSGRCRRELATQQHRKVDSNVARGPRRFRWFGKKLRRSAPTLILQSQEQLQY
jgi:hypothetical protein